MPDNKTLWQVSLSKGYFWDSLAGDRFKFCVNAKN